MGYTLKIGIYVDVWFHEKTSNLKFAKIRIE